MIPMKNSFVFAATGTSKVATLYNNGIIIAYTMVTPNFTNNSTSQLSIQDEDGVTIYTGAAHNESGTYVVTGLAIPCDRQYTATITISTDAGGTGGTVVAKLFLKQQE